jgi:hypothetical protein
MDFPKERIKSGFNASFSFAISNKMIMRLIVYSDWRFEIVSVTTTAFCFLPNHPILVELLDQDFADPAQSGFFKC